MFDIHKLEIFKKVSELKSFSKAAKDMYLTQPTVSQHIHWLENFFGVKLFDRLGKEVTLTKAGEILYSYAQQIVSLAGEAQQALDHYIGRKKGHLVVGGSTIPGEYILPPLLGEFKKRYPEITVTLRIGDTEEIIEELLNNRIELGIIGAKIQNPRLHFTRFIDEELFVIVPKGHRWWRKTSVDAGELSEEPFIMREQGSGTRMSMEKKLRSSGVLPEKLNMIIEAGSTTAVKEAVRAGLGISIISGLAVRDDVRMKSMKKLRINNIRLTRRFFTVQDKRRTSSPLCKDFVGFLSQKK